MMQPREGYSPDPFNFFFAGVYGVGIKAWNEIQFIAGMRAEYQKTMAFLPTTFIKAIK